MRAAHEINAGRLPETDGCQLSTASATCIDRNMRYASQRLLSRTRAWQTLVFHTRLGPKIRMSDLVIVRKEGLYCVPGQFYIDPWQPVDRAVITHAHGDHARTGHGHYLAAAAPVDTLQA